MDYLVDETVKYSLQNRYCMMKRMKFNDAGSKKNNNMYE